MLKTRIGMIAYLTLATVMIGNQIPVYADVPTAAPSETPVLEWESVDPSGSLQVGDVLHLRAKNLQLPGIKIPSQELKWEATESDLDLAKEGWDLNVLPPSNKIPASEFRVEALTLKPGNLTLPSLFLKGPSGNILARILPFSVKVESAISPKDPAPDQPADVEPPVGIKFPILFVISASILALLILVGLGYWAWIQYQKRSAHKRVFQKEVIPEDVVALKSLRDLEGQGLMAKGQFKSHYFTASEILKQYVGARYGFDALESTTREMIQALEEQKEANVKSVRSLEEIFVLLDRVKFTDFVPSIAEASELVQKAKLFVELTRRVPLVSHEVNDAPR